MITSVTLNTTLYQTQFIEVLEHSRTRGNIITNQVSGKWLEIVRVCKAVMGEYQKLHREKTS